MRRIFWQIFCKIFFQKLKSLWDQKAASPRSVPRTDRPLHRGGLRINLNPKYFLPSWGEGPWSVRIPNTTGRLWDEHEIIWQEARKIGKSIILLWDWRQKENINVIMFKRNVQECLLSIVMALFFSFRSALWLSELKSQHWGWRSASHRSSKSSWAWSLTLSGAFPFLSSLCEPFFIFLSIFLSFVDFSAEIISFFQVPCWW